MSAVSRWPFVTSCSWAVTLLSVWPLGGHRGWDMKTFSKFAFKDVTRTLLTSLIYQLASSPQNADVYSFKPGLLH